MTLKRTSVFLCVALLLTVSFLTLFNSVTAEDTITAFEGGLTTADITFPGGGMSPTIMNGWYVGKMAARRIEKLRKR